MKKLRITLTLDEETARQLAATLEIGAAHRFAPPLQRASAEIADYVAGRIGRAKLAQRRAARRAEAE